jgi:hypothetical protein
MLRQVLRTLTSTALVFGAVAAVSAGCTRQAEGERCDFEWAQDQDCAEGLVCIPCGDLLSSNGADRCCPAAGNSTDPRCTPTQSPSGVACSSHHSGTGGTTSTGGGDAGDAGAGS